jgi:hypothetical protein
MIEVCVEAVGASGVDGIMILRFGATRAVMTGVGVTAGGASGAAGVMIVTMGSCAITGGATGVGSTVGGAAGRVGTVGAETCWAMA